MIRYRRDRQMLPIALAVLSGFVDALGFLHLGGVFISFMSGNSTRFAIGLAGLPEGSVLAGAVIVLFVAGVVAGALTGGRGGDKPIVLVLVTALLGLAAIAHAVRQDVAAIAGMTLAMGGINTVFQRDGEVSVGVTYMTGTLVKLGQRIAAALRGGDRWSWLPYLLLWSGLAAGAMAGALAYRVAGLAALWPATGLAGLIALVSRRLRPA